MRSAILVGTAHAFEPVASLNAFACADSARRRRA